VLRRLHRRLTSKAPFRGFSALPSPQPAPIDADAFIDRIHASGTRFVLATTGGASEAISALLTVPGGSRTVLEATVPYSAAALVAWLGTPPEQFCHEYTARLMAMAAYQRAVGYSQSEDRQESVAGVACTASLASDRPKHGAHRVHVAAQTADFTAVASVELVKGARDRKEEERVAARLLLNVVAWACNLPDRLPLELLAGEHAVEEDTDAPATWRDLFLGKVSAVPAGESSRVRTRHKERSAGAAPASRRTIFPGAFHPLHDGHRRMAHVAVVRLGIPVEWELSITNVDKPPLDYHEMRLRAEQFDAKTPLWFTRAPTFVEKAQIFRGATFVVGADTIARIAEPRYYDDDPHVCQEAMAAIAGAGCRFLVFGRKTPDGFETLSDLTLPPALRQICDEVPASEFRADVSSTELRQVEAQADAANS
jgi:nicotinamide mononucleotide (NMN) deamidase PncC